MRAARLSAGLGHVSCGTGARRPSDERPPARQLHDQPLQRAAHRVDTRCSSTTSRTSPRFPRSASAARWTPTADGNVSDAEAAAYAQTQCATLASELDLEVGGARQSLGADPARDQLPDGPGQPDHAPGVRVRAPLARRSAAAAPRSHFTGRTYAERQGWREIIVAGDGTTLSGTDLTSESASDRLTHYPADLLTVPLGQARRRSSRIAGAACHCPPSRFPTRRRSRSTQRPTSWSRPRRRRPPMARARPCPPA